MLLNTKLTIPPLSAKRVVRPELISRLHAGLGARLALVSAPPGFGKTTLVREWLAELEPDRAIAWLSLDEDDNDPARFWRHLMASLKRALPGMESPFAGPLPPSRSVASALINQLSERPQPVLLVLDDYHVIQTPEIHESISLLINNQPQGLHLVLTSREDPPLPLARLRVRGQLSELRAADLRFAPDAVDTFLNGMMGLELAPDDVLMLAERTEGWIAGLQLAGLSMQGLKDRHGFVSAFTGSHRYVFDYLVEEILERQPPELQRFLLETSILDRLSGALCDAVTGRKDGQALLEELEQANLLLIPLDDERQWYRYHHLFTDALRLMLKRRHPERLPALHLAASDWYEQEDGITEAVSHALKADAHARAAQLLWKAEPLWRRGETLSLRSWLNQLPEATLQTHPRLYLLHAWALMPTGRFEALHAMLEKAEAAHRNEGDPDMIAPMTALRAYLARWREAIPEAIRLAEDALARLPEDDWMWRGLVELTLAAATRYAGDLEGSCRLYAAIAERSRREEPYFAIVATCMQASVRIEAGQLRHAQALYQEALEIASRHGGRSWGVTGLALVGLGEILWEGDRPEEAAAMLIEGLTCGGWLPQVSVYGGLTLARLHAAQGKADEAQQALANVRAAAEEAGTLQAKDTVLGGMAAVWDLLDAPTRQRLRGWGAMVSSEVPDGPLSEVRRMKLLAKARILLHDGALQEAEALLDALCRLAESTGRLGVALEATALRADALERLNRPSEASALRRQAQALGEPEGYVRLIAQAPDRPQPAIPERLSDRELEVLGLIAQGATNQRIADTLKLSLLTAKKHSSNILGKLGAANRTEAAARARELGLI